VSAVVVDGADWSSVSTSYIPLARFGAELWIRGDPDEIGVALARLPSPPFSVVPPQRSRTSPACGCDHTFCVVNALG
jgi:hypothetical protein